MPISGLAVGRPLTAIIALGLFEVSIVPDEGDFEEYSTLNANDTCGRYKATVNPFPVHDDPKREKQEVSGDAQNRIFKYIEVTEGAYYQFDFVIKQGFDFTCCDSVKFVLYKD